MNLLYSMTPELILTMIHPRFYALHTMDPTCGTLQQNGLAMPPLLYLSSEKLERHGVYLLDVGTDLFLWFGKNASPDICKALFNVDYHSLPIGKVNGMVKI